MVDKESSFPSIHTIHFGWSKKKVEEEDVKKEQKRWLHT